MSDLEVILNRIRKQQAEREGQGLGYDQKGGSVKDKWREIGYDSALEWVANEIEQLQAERAVR